VVSQETLLQVNCTIIAGLLVFLTISSLVEPLFFSPRADEYTENNGSTGKMPDKSNENVMIRGIYISQLNKIMTIFSFTILIFPFAISSILILLGKPKWAPPTTAVGLLGLMVIGVALVTVQYHLSEIAKSSI